MKNIKITFFFIISGLLLFWSSAEAHQPNFTNKENRIEIFNPEVSQAFYGFLDNEPASYSIDSDSPFQLYVGLLTPDLPNSQNNLSANIKDGKGKELAGLDGLNNFTWQRWYEEFAGDWYWKGPEFKKEVLAGKYTITVSNPNNNGPYVLVVGELESFPLSQTPEMFNDLFKIKTEFFHKPWYSVFQNKIGKYIGIFLLMTALISTGIIFLIKFIKNRRSA